MAVTLHVDAGSPHPLCRVKNRRSNSGVEPSAQLFGILPVDVILVIRVEVNLPDFVFAAAPNHFSSQPHCESSFVVNTKPLAREVCDHEL